MRTVSPPIHWRYYPDCPCSSKNRCQEFVKKVLRLLRRVRRALGPCRNLDFNLDLIKDKHQQASAAAVQRAWAEVHDELEAKRGALIESRRGVFEIYAGDSIPGVSYTWVAGCRRVLDATYEFGTAPHSVVV